MHFESLWYPPDWFLNHVRASPRRHLGRSARISASRNSDRQCSMRSQKVWALWNRQSSGKSYCSDGSRNPMSFINGFGDSFGDGFGNGFSGDIREDDFSGLFWNIGQFPEWIRCSSSGSSSGSQSHKRVLHLRQTTLSA